MNTYFKRFACLFLVVPLFVFFMIPSAAADSLPQSSVFDILASADSFMRLHTFEYLAIPVLDATKNSGLDSDVGLRISTNAPFLFDRLYLTLYSQTAPVAVYCNSVAGERIRNDDTFSVWEFLIPSEPTSVFDLKATMPRGFSGWADLGVGSFYGWYENEVVVDYAEFYLDCSGTSTHFPSSASCDLPCVLDMWTEYDGALPASFIFKAEIEPPLSYTDTMQVTLSVPVVLASGTVSLDRDFLSSLLDVSFFVAAPGFGGNIRPLDIVSEDIGSCFVSDIDTFGSYLYTFTVDTSGFDFGEYVVCAEFCLRAFDMAEFSYQGDWIKEYFSQLYFWPVYFSLPSSYPNFFAGFVGRFEEYKFNFNTWMEETFYMVDSRLTSVYAAITGKDPGASAEAGTIQDGFDQLENFEDGLEAVFNEASNDMVTGVGAGITSFGPALAFVGHWLTNIADSIGPFHIVLTWPIFIGICMFIYHRVPGVTRVGRSGKNDGGGEDAG